MSMVYEILTGDVDGLNVAFTSSQIPEWGTLHVFVDGVEVTVSSFTETTITLAAAPVSGIVFAVYNVKPDEPTAADLIAAALGEIGVKSREDEANIKDLNIGLFYLNLLLEDSNITPGMIYTVHHNEYTLTANKQEYTIGVDPAGILVADFQAQRPTKIKQILLQLQSAPTVVYDQPMVSLEDEEWAQKRIRAIYAIPKQYHFHEEYPLASLDFWPAPSGPYVIEIWTWHQVSRVTDLADVLTFPPGYRSAYLYELALRLCTPFAREIPQSLLPNRELAMNRLAHQNYKAPTLETDPALVGGPAPGFNWRSGGY